MFFDLLPGTYFEDIFHVKIQLFVTLSLTRIRIRMDPHWFDSLDSDLDSDLNEIKKLDPDSDPDPH